MHDDTPSPVPQSKKRISITTPAAIVTAGVIIALALFLTRGGAPTPSRPSPTPESGALEQPSKKISVAPTDAIRGDIQNADVIIVEYSDSDCPYCARFHETMKALLASDKKVAWVYRHFPLSIHPNAEQEAIAIECAQQLGGDTAFWNYLDEVIGVTLSPEKSKSLLTTIATTQGLNGAAFTSCLDSTSAKATVTAQSNEAQSLGARGTPFSIAINTKTNEQVVIPGALPLENLQALIAQLR